MQKAGENRTVSEKINLSERRRQSFRIRGIGSLSRLHKGSWLGLLIWLLILGAFIRLSLDAGISGDEYLHLNQSYKVMDYYKSFGKDKSAMHTPKTYLKYYGQSFDNTATLISEIFNIEDIFTLRHILNAFAAWLTVLFTFLTARELSNKRTAIFAVILLLLSPRFIGHSFNNLKDIPFALGFIASLYFILKYLKKLRNSPNSIKAGLIIVIAFTLSIRPAGLLIIIYLWMFAGIRMLQLHKLNLKEIWQETVPLFFISFTGYFAGLLFWPYALENPLWHPIESTIVMTDYYITIRQLFEGTLYWSDQLPWYYLVKYISITIPAAVLTGVALSIIYFKKSLFKQKSSLPLGILLFFTLFPILFILIKSSNVYGAWRHVLFIYPPLVIISALGYNWSAEKIKKRASKYILAIIALLLLSEPLMFMVRNHPYEIVYFNPLIGGIKGARGNYEMDYYYHSTREASEKLKKYIQIHNEDSITVAGNFETAWFFRNFPAVTKNIYTPYYYKNSKDWDYNIITAAYMTPFSLQPEKWPPENSIITIDVDKVPVCAVLKRQTKDDWKAIKLIKEGQTDSAIVLLRDVINKYPDNETAYLELGKVYMNMARYLLAEETFTQCLKVLPAYEPAYYYLAEVQFKMGEKKIAIKTLKKILTINSKYLLAYINLADYYIILNKNKDAKSILEECLKIKPKYTKASDRLDKIKDKEKQK